MCQYFWCKRLGDLNEKVSKLTVEGLTEGHGIINKVKRNVEQFVELCTEKRICD